MKILTSAQIGKNKPQGLREKLITYNCVALMATKFSKFHSELNENLMIPVGWASPDLFLVRILVRISFVRILGHFFLRFRI